jgi:hypothetical protein
MPDATLTSERRKEQRKRPVGLVYVELSASNGGMLRDLSENGFAMRAMMPLRPGDSSSFVFTLDPETRLQGQCKVQWVEEDGRVAGLEFTNVSTDLPGKVRAWLLENSFPVPSVSFPVKPASPAVLASPEASTLQELREELRSIVPNSHNSKPTETKLHQELRSIAPNARDSETEETKPHQEPEAPLLRIEPHPIWVQTRNTETPSIESQPAVGAFVAPPSMTTAPTPDAPPRLAAPPALEPLSAFSEIASFNEPGLMSRGLARSSISLAIRMMLVLALVACAVVFHRSLGTTVIWLGHKIAGSDAPEISYPPKSAESSQQVTPPVTNNPVSPSVDAPALPTTGSAATANDSADNSASPATPRKNVEVPAVMANTSPQPEKTPPVASAPAPVPLPATNRTTTFSAATNPGPDQAGQQEYLAAEDILKNRNSTSGLSEAVRLLWVAVEKGNSNAEVALAALYRSGHGVTKSCDQTGILLNAAAKKGNSEAQRRLNEFLKEGCE